MGHAPGGQTTLGERLHKAVQRDQAALHVAGFDAFPDSGIIDGLGLLKVVPGLETFGQIQDFKQGLGSVCCSSLSAPNRVRQAVIMASSDVGDMIGSKAVTLR